MEIREGFYQWRTETAHFDNSETMTDFLENEIEDSYEILFREDNECELDVNGIRYGIVTYGDGDSFSHVAEIKIIC